MPNFMTQSNASVDLYFADMLGDGGRTLRLSRYKYNLVQTKNP